MRPLRPILIRKKEIQRADFTAPASPELSEVLNPSSHSSISRLNQPFVLVLTALIAINSSGCITPVVLNEDSIAIGLYRIKKSKPLDGVKHRYLKGGGLYFLNGCLGIGLVNVETLKLDGRGQGHAVRLELRSSSQWDEVVMYSGAAADHAAHVAFVDRRNLNRSDQSCAQVAMP